ncbi:hypothetical protein BJP40_00190 [Streptomyces sp. CC53]|nr:hypothetical protein BJP40_00190 [Streptomyces sp. CC53]
MYKHPQPTPTLFDALPKVRAKDLRPGDLLMHRAFCGGEGGARPVLRIEFGPEGDRVRIIQAQEPVRCHPKTILFPDGESASVAGADQLVTLAPPYWPHGVTRRITRLDVAAARAHAGDREAR